MSLLNADQVLNSGPIIFQDAVNQEQSEGDYFGVALDLLDDFEEENSLEGQYDSTEEDIKNFFR